jgi:hypothetical protein
MRARARAVLVGMVAAALLLCAAAPASAETYTVTRTDDPVTGPCEPDDCSLREALTASNNSTTVDDVVILPAAAAPYLIQDESFTLPVADEVEIRGAGAEETVVKGSPEGVAFTIGGFKTTLVGLTITGARGAIQNNGNLTLREVSIEGNERDIDSGGVKSNGPLRIESSFIGFNRSEAGTGGGVQSNGAVTIVNSTIAHNSSATGPGGIGANSSVTIANSAVVSNRSDSAGDVGAGASTLIVRDSVFADNRSPSGLLNCDSSDPLTSLGGNVSDDATCGTTGTDKTNVNPLLGSLGLNGGTTLVYDLLAGSPAIDAASQCPPLDQRGVARPQGAACDSGPYEVQVVSTLPTGQVLIRLGKRNLKLSRSGFVRARVTCVSTEGSSPCRGKVTLRGRFRYPSKKASASVQRYPSATFQIPVGQSKGVRIRIPRPTTESLWRRGKAKKVTVQVRARDAAGNSSSILARKKIVPAKRG